MVIMKKRYWVSDIIKILGICKKTYYLWEASGKIPKAKRDNMNNYRYWTEEDVEQLKKITGR
ncbi:MAG: MerR family transcriptional regulator [Candidatus Omnitrophica bacterium]|nr:MerR family transcriptional regulator [Candidatus Omnitrophota bacterium]